MTAIISFLGKLVKKLRLPTPGKETHDILQRGRKASKIPEYYYYIKYATSVLGVIAWVVLVLGFIGAL
ncbi:MAG TPA: hypothetical protein VIH69_07485, partial [Dehalococcoidia bacterium]